ncbi:MAG: type III secretion system chaperone [Acetobacteraceae bacterium]
MDRAEMQHLVAELAPAWDDVRAIAIVHTGAWAVQFADGRTVGIEHEPAAGRVVISAGLGRVPEEHRLAVYAAMLNFNALGGEVGGARLSLTGAEREAELSAVLADEGLSLDGLRAALGFLADSARAWTAMMRDPGAAGLQPPPGAVRV